MRISDWSSDVCSSDLATEDVEGIRHTDRRAVDVVDVRAATGPGTSGAGIGLLPRGLPVEIEARPVTTICGPGIFLRLAQRSLSRGTAWTVRERPIDTLADPVPPKQPTGHPPARER